MTYKVTSDIFEGPLDLLLDLIESHKLKITKVSLAKIADGFLAEVKRLQEVKAESLADFLVVASQLLLIKSRALLPLLVSEEQEGARGEELTARLEELKKFRIAAQKLSKMLAKKHIAAARAPLVKKVFYPPPKTTLADVKNAFLAVIDQLPAADLLEEEVVPEVISLEDKLAAIRNNLNQVSKLSFERLADKKNKTEIIVTFLAMLELLKQRLVTVEQGELFGEITIKAMRSDLS